MRSSSRISPTNYVSKSYRFIIIIVIWYGAHAYTDIHEHIHTRDHDHAKSSIGSNYVAAASASVERAPRLASIDDAAATAAVATAVAAVVADDGDDDDKCKFRAVCMRDAWHLPTTHTDTCMLQNAFNLKVERTAQVVFVYCWLV